INEFAAELARVTVWIGDIQWCRQNGWPHSLNPILKPLDGIENRDALLNTDGTEATWPKAHVIVGNPPFLGGSVMRGELGDTYVETLRKTYDGCVPGGADLVCYWFEKARAQIKDNKLQAAGFVSTQSIRKGSNRTVLERIINSSRIFLAWSDEPWVNDGASVRVSMTGFGNLKTQAKLDDLPVSSINADLTTGDGLDLTKAIPLTENSNTSFEGTKKYGDFDIPGHVARSWLSAANPNGKPNSQVVKPWVNGNDITKRPSDTWIIDFGTDMSEVDATLFEQPYEHLLQNVKPYRANANRNGDAGKWWLHERARPALREAIKNLTRYIATVRVAKHRFFTWLPTSVLPDTRLCVIARQDDCTFGILSSRMHTVWTLANSSRHGDGDEGGRPTYNGKSCFETFPFPEGLTPKDTTEPIVETDITKDISRFARELDEQRRNVIFPPTMVEWVITPEEEEAGFPKRPVAKTGFEEKVKKLTLTNLYNKPPTWLTNAHQALDAAVAKAYGWEDYTPQISDEEILKRLFEMNLKRSKPVTSKAKGATRKK
ncbi:class I SAM-dependent DNA methyltransferase, partial [Comamonas aquatica]